MSAGTNAFEVANKAYFQPIEKSRDKIAQLSRQNSQLEPTLKNKADDILRNIRDEETASMEHLAARRRALDQNEWLRKRYNNLQEDYFYFSNKYEKMLIAKDLGNEQGADSEAFERLKQEKDHLSKLLNNTIEDNEKLSTKVRATELTEMIAPILISKLLGDDPEERLIKMSNEALQAKNELVEARAEIQSVLAEKERYHNLYEQERSRNRTLVIEEKTYRQNQRADFDKLMHSHVAKKQEFHKTQLEKREMEANDERKILIDRIEAFKSRNDQFDKENLDLNRKLIEKDKEIARQGVEIMNLKNNIIDLNSQLDLAQTEKEVNLTAKHNANRQIEFMKHQIDEMKATMEKITERASACKYELDMKIREKEVDAEKIANLQFDLHNMTVENGGLQRVM
jgi:hypothetical protein